MNIAYFKPYSKHLLDRSLASCWIGRLFTILWWIEVLVAEKEPFIRQTDPLERDVLLFQERVGQVSTAHLLDHIHTAELVVEQVQRLLVDKSTRQRVEQLVASLSLHFGTISSVDLGEGKGGG